MRANLVSPSSSQLSYAIREIVEFGEIVRQHGVDVTWENIGDPIAKGEKVAPWIRDIVHEVVEIDDSWGYCPTEGFMEAREALAEHVNRARRRPGHGRRHHLLQRRGRRGGQGLRLPERARPGHRSLAGLQHPFVGRVGALRPAAHHLRPRSRERLDARPRRPAAQDRDAIPSIAGILIINPNNPTGAVYPPEVLEQIVALAREFGLFLVADEIYIHMVFPGVETVHLSEVATDVPAIVMRGISKELPWPGSRCGWIEVLNRSTRPELLRLRRFAWSRPSGWRSAPPAGRS